MERPPPTVPPNPPRLNAQGKPSHTRAYNSPSLTPPRQRVAQIPVLWLTTAPVGDDATPLHSAPPRQYNQLPDLKFSFSPDNRITSRIINRATEVGRSFFHVSSHTHSSHQLMLEAATQFQGGPVGFHLFIVAASAPIQGTWGVSATMPTQIGQSEWRLLGQRIAQVRDAIIAAHHIQLILPSQLRIHCHMILPVSQDMSSMNELFAASVRDLPGSPDLAN